MPAIFFSMGLEQLNNKSPEIKITRQNKTLFFMVLGFDLGESLIKYQNMDVFAAKL